MPTVLARRIIAAPQEAVWAALSDIENASRWNSAWSRVEFLGEKRQGEGTVFRAHSDDGGSAEFEVVRWVPEEYIAFAPHGADEEDYLITLEGHAVHLRPLSEDQTEVTIVASARSHGIRGWLAGRLVWPGYQKEGLKRALERLAALFEPEEEEE
ncbi:MAG: SRPBCC family protein [Chloroflexi bacterium]|nr:SRPBCC family protein [Chloroflexota bacterium]